MQGELRLRARTQPCNLPYQLLRLLLRSPLLLQRPEPRALRGAGMRAPGQLCLQPRGLLLLHPTAKGREVGAREAGLVAGAVPWKG